MISSVTSIFIRLRMIAWLITLSTMSLQLPRVLCIDSSSSTPSPSCSYNQCSQLPPPPAPPDFRLIFTDTFSSLMSVTSAAGGSQLDELRHRLSSSDVIGNDTVGSCLSGDTAFLYNNSQGAPGLTPTYSVSSSSKPLRQPEAVTAAAAAETDAFPVTSVIVICFVVGGGLLLLTGIAVIVSCYCTRRKWRSCHEVTSSMDESSPGQEIVARTGSDVVNATRSVETRNGKQTKEHRKILSSCVQRQPSSLSETISVRDLLRSDSVYQAGQSTPPPSEWKRQQQQQRRLATTVSVVNETDVDDGSEMPNFDSEDRKSTAVDGFCV